MNGYLRENGDAGCAAKCSKCGTAPAPLALGIKGPRTPSTRRCSVDNMRPLNKGCQHLNRHSERISMYIGTCTPVAAMSLSPASQSHDGTSEPERDQDLWSVAARGDIERLDVLLEGDYSVEATFAALQAASDGGYFEAVDQLLSTDKIDIDAYDEDGQTLLSYAAENGCEALVKLLLSTGKANINAKDKYGLTPLSYAVKNDHQAVVKLLLGTDKADVNAEDNGGRTPLFWAAKNGLEAIARLLLGTGKVTNVNAESGRGQTPLWWAARNGDEAIVKLLLGTGKVDIHVKDEDGRTPLFWAYRNGDEAITRLLLGVGKVDVDTKPQ